ncbi:MAG: hypothetical protein P8Z30_02690 [Acidobacteriota bacterium]
MNTQDESRTNREERDSVETLRRLKKGISQDLPTTFQPYFNQQVHSWDFLFPYERQYLLEVLTYLDQLSPDQRLQLFAPIRRLEKAMDVRRWDFSVREQTLEDASLLARSPYYFKWRGEVKKAFDQIDRGVEEDKKKHAKRLPNRLILMIYPACLPFDPATMWKRWPGTGKAMHFDADISGNERKFVEDLFGARGHAGTQASGTLLESIAQRANGSFADVWALDAGTALSKFMLGAGGHPDPVPGVTVLSFERLKSFRENFLKQVNTMSHNLSSADQIYNQIRKEDVSQFCPPEIKDRPIIREVVRSLFMNGNGASVWGNPFVQWGASEVFRRARPSVLIGYFGTRNKPKPFTSVAVFMNQNKVNPLPAVKDLPGSAIDASMLSYYLWLSSTRYSEYQNALTVCLAESIKTAYIVGPTSNPLQGQTQPLSLARISSALSEWLSAPV